MQTWANVCLLFAASISSTYASELLLEHSSQPLQAEAKIEALEPWETPINGFFIRSHHGVPLIDENKWILQIDGMVDHPLKFTLAELRQLKAQTLHAVLECSGNGRAKQTPPAPGVQWKKAAFGNAEWTGVPIAELLKKAGVRPGAQFARIEGADKPTLPSVPAFIRSIPIDKLMQSNTLLAWKMNREPLPVLHGGPVRLILPGWYGENWTKWIAHITLTDKEDSSFYMKKGYRMPKNPVSPGEAWDASTGAPIERLLVQSFIVSPGEDKILPVGTHTIRGKAFSGERTITKVEVTRDSGKTWQEAKLEAPRASGGWQEFSIELKFETPGTVTLASRATDSQGDVQPMTHTWNPGGYLRNSVDSVSVQFATPVAIQGHTVMMNQCKTCHSLKLVESQRLSSKQWEGVVKKMEGFGVSLTDDSRTSLLAYLTQLSPSLVPAQPKPLSYESYEQQNSLTHQKVNAVSYKSSNKIKVKDKGNQKHGEKLFTQYCAACHGAQGEGRIGPRLQQRLIPPADFLNTVRTGRNTMPSFEKILKENDIQDIRTYLGSF